MGTQAKATRFYKPIMYTHVANATLLSVLGNSVLLKNGFECLIRGNSVKTRQVIGSEPKSWYFPLSPWCSLSLAAWASEKDHDQKAVNHSCCPNFGTGWLKGLWFYKETFISSWLKAGEGRGKRRRGNCGSKFTCERDPGAVCIRVLIRQYSWSRLQPWLKPDLTLSFEGKLS